MQVCVQTGCVLELAQRAADVSRSADVVEHSVAIDTRKDDQALLICATIRLVGIKVQMRKWISR